jgi:TRAP transporter 4TM/12TM fusion protein
LFYVALFIQVDLEAARNNIAPIDPSQIPPLGRVLKAGWYFPIPFVVLVYALFWMNYEADTAGLMAIGTVLILALLFKINNQRIGPADLYEMLRDTGFTVLDLFMIGMAAGIIIGSLNYAGVGFSLTLSLLHMGGDTLIGLLLLAAVASIILGMGMPTVGVYILLATLIAPALVEMKIPPMAAHMFILYYGCLSMITPPVAIGAFAAANLAGADPMRTGYRAMVFGWTVFVIPFLFVFSTTLLMQGSALAIVLDFVTAIAGVWLISAALMSYSMRPLGIIDRALYLVAGICLLLPVGIFATARWFNVAGAAVGGALIVWEWSKRSSKASEKATPRTT